MSAIEAIELHDGRPGTSAEPAIDDWPQDEPRVCQEVVFADMVAGTDIPLLTPADLDWARALIHPDPSQVRALVESRREARRALVSDAEARTPQEVCAAAFRVERAVQDRLWLLGGPGSAVREKRNSMDAWNAQWQAHQAVLAKTGSRMSAKDLQRKAARGGPALTVCVGRKLRRLPDVELRRHAPDLLEHYGENIVWIGGDGCGTIILDSSEPRPPKKYCDRCAKKAGNTMNAGLAKNALARLKASRKPR